MWLGRASATGSQRPPYVTRPADQWGSTDPLMQPPCFQAFAEKHASLLVVTRRSNSGPLMTPPLGQLRKGHWANSRVMWHFLQAWQSQRPSQATTLVEMVSRLLQSCTLAVMCCSSSWSCWRQFWPYHIRDPCSPGAPRYLPNRLGLSRRLAAMVADSHSSKSGVRQAACATAGSLCFCRMNIGYQTQAGLTAHCRTQLSPAG